MSPENSENHENIIFNPVPENSPRSIRFRNAFQEWKLLSNLLQHTPSYEEIERLHDVGETKYAPSVYAKKFGSGRFYRAKEILEEITLRPTSPPTPLEEGGFITPHKEATLPPPMPSRNYAWILGALSGGGYVDTKRGTIRMICSNDQFIKEFGIIAEQVFQVNAYTRPYKEKSLKTEIHYGSLNISSIGSLTKKDWPDTIIHKHPWVLGNTLYSCGFLEGYFDTSGAIVFESRGFKKGKQKRKWRIHLYTIYPEAVSLLADILTRVGIESPKQLHSSPSHSKDSTECNLLKIAGVRISKAVDIRNFALNVHSKVPEKEEKLNSLRQNS